MNKDQATKRVKAAAQIERTIKDFESIDDQRARFVESIKEALGSDYDPSALRYDENGDPHYENVRFMPRHVHASRVQVIDALPPDVKGPAVIDYDKDAGTWVETEFAVYKAVGGGPE